MERSDARNIFDSDFCGRYDVSLKSKGAMAADWLDAMLPYTIDIVKDTIKLLYEESTHKPSIAEFKKKASEIARERNQKVVVSEEVKYVYAPVFVQLTARKGEINGFRPKETANGLGQFKRIGYFEHQNPSPYQIGRAAELLRDKLFKVYGGQWEILDFRQDDKFTDERHIMEYMVKAKERIFKESRGQVAANVIPAPAIPSTFEDIDWTADEIEEEEFNRI